jgi:hypothetical protein
MGTLWKNDICVVDVVEKTAEIPFYSPMPLEVTENPSIPWAGRDTCSNGQAIHSFQVIGACLGYSGDVFGTTPVDAPYSYVWMGNIQDQCGDDETKEYLVSARTFLHELIHQMGFRGHCSRSSCIMYGSFDIDRPEDIVFAICDKCVSRLDTLSAQWTYTRDCGGGGLLVAVKELSARAAVGVFGKPALANGSNSPCTEGISRLGDDAAGFSGLPTEVGGLTLGLSAVRDTFLLGEPVVLEVFLNNRGHQDIKDPCYLNPTYGFLDLYVLCEDSKAMRLDSAGDATVGVIRDLILPPGSVVGTLVSVGSKHLLVTDGTRGPGEFQRNHFRLPGRYSVFAVYHLPEADKRPSPEVANARSIRSEVINFDVIEPTGTDLAVYDALKDDVLIRGPIEVLEQALHLGTRSPYGPFVEALCARRPIRGKVRRESSDYVEAANLLREVVGRHRGLRLAQEWEFDIADFLCLADRNQEARALYDSLSVKYPQNVRSYQTCRMDRPQLTVYENVTVRRQGGE